jgi:hypothetical protein
MGERDIQQGTETARVGERQIEGERVIKRGRET